jgi:hypothetical protein
MQARADVTAIREAYRMSERQACKLAGMAISSYRYQARCAQSDEALKARLTALAQQYPRFGSPRLCVLVRREQIHNHKRVERIYREAGLSLRRKKRKRLSRQRSAAMAVRMANEEWALDFVTDVLASARHVRILTVVDVFTRECLALEADTSMGSLRVLRVLGPHHRRTRLAPTHPQRQWPGVHQPCVSGLEPGTKNRSGAHPAGQAHRECPRRKFQRPLTRGMPQRELVPQSVRRAAPDRNLARPLQRGPAA